MKKVIACINRCEEISKPKFILKYISTAAIPILERSHKVLSFDLENVKSVSFIGEIRVRRRLPFTKPVN